MNWLTNERRIEHVRLGLLHPGCATCRDHIFPRILSILAMRNR